MEPRTTRSGRVRRNYLIGATHAGRNGYRKATGCAISTRMAGMPPISRGALVVVRMSAGASSFLASRSHVFGSVSSCQALSERADRNPESMPSGKNESEPGNPLGIPTTPRPDSAEHPFGPRPGYGNTRERPGDVSTHPSPGNTRTDPYRQPPPRPPGTTTPGEHRNRAHPRTHRNQTSAWNRARHRTIHHQARYSPPPVESLLALCGILHPCQHTRPQPPQATRSRTRQRWCSTRATKHHCVRPGGCSGGSPTSSTPSRTRRRTTPPARGTP